MLILKQLSESDLNLYETEMKRYIYDLLEIDNKSLSKHDLISERDMLYFDMRKYTLDKSATILGAFEDGLVGFLWAYKKRFFGEERYHISYFFVNDRHRNTGIGSRLLDYIHEIALKNDIKEIELMVNKENEAAIEFYKKHDFYIERLKLCKHILKKSMR